ncbi:porin family protein [Sphingobacterium oryzagri]|uniref:Porin family protein n=1 Tax=Sphingobacterium oryzagri TaxID=3025669 RepID=A0ABY7WJQ6_9SPHI|nr:porin family protein [Sphingobacterium sp. KACC 22765]WDF69831.1 porin family protein [Sphingobacterium sp. KACC 22765]
MKKILLSLGAALLLAAGAQAQTSWGLKAGVNLGKYSNFGDDQKNNTSFHVTGFADVPVAANFSIQPGVSLQGKGTRFFEDYEGFGYGEFSRNVMSVEIPVNAVYWIPAGSGSVFLGAGPYIGFNVSGKERLRGDIGNFSGQTEWDLDFSGDDRDMNVIDAGANFMAGYKLANGFLLNAGYNLGLTQLVPGFDNKVSNRVWSFGVGFQF